MNLSNSFFNYYGSINKDTETFVSYLKELGYDEIALHPGTRDFYDRDQAYQAMGFDSFYDMQKFQNKEYYRTYISDHALTDEIIYRYEEHLRNNQDAPLFCFAVSIANHVTLLDMGDNVAAVEEDTYEERIRVETKETVAPETERELREYVNGLKETVDALERLLKYFEQCGEDVVVVFYGDHAPRFVRDLYVKENTDCLYKTPYLIWSNFDLDPVETEDFNASYLSAVLMDLLHMPLTNRYYINKYFLEKYPINTRYIKRDSQGNNILKELDDFQNSVAIEDFIEDSLNVKSVEKLQMETTEKMDFWSME
ncbi:MAG: LTA synthase family protein [Alistipes sp.]|nr:LTA synthase family protein [Alistipes sp.]